MATSGHGPGVAVVALVASAGGLEALSTVLCDLPPDFPAAVVVQQHLGGHTSVLPTILGRLTGVRSAGRGRDRPSHRGRWSSARPKCCWN